MTQFIIMVLNSVASVTKIHIYDESW